MKEEHVDDIMRSLIVNNEGTTRDIDDKIYVNDVLRLLCNIYNEYVIHKIYRVINVGIRNQNTH